ncbi:ABC transporter permease subunit [Oceaniradius stylonematis]|uniref:ABC transporter permease subunit n=1 Tax=Oceaniradius stylonematis TaxID=2184161 RepID=A0A3A8ALS6_9HYPH|nr:ABC transporter permease subunit [Oceaniradius stylonematis]RKF08590.1 ABC transporter permease subunit [Oceaniradius stylonematis]
MLRFAPPLALFVLAAPLACGLMGTVLPAFGFLPALGGYQLSTRPFADLFGQPGLWRSALQALMIGLLTTAISLAMVAGFVCAWYGTRAFRLIQHLVSPLLAVPHAAAAFGFAFMIAPSGYLARLFSPWATGWERPPDLLVVNDPAGFALIAGLVIKEVPFLLLVTLAALPQVPALRSLRLSQSLGYGRMMGFMFTAWPPLYRQIRLAVFAVIAYASANVDVAFILGPTTPQTLPVRLVGWMNDPELSMRFMACAGACLQIAVTAVALLIWVALERIAGPVAEGICETGRRFRRDGFARLAAGGMMAASALLVFGGLGVLALWSVSGLWQFPSALPDALTWRTWQRTGPALSGPLATTIIIALAATAISVAIALACLQRENETGRTGGNRALALVYLPLLVPQIGFLFGLQLLLIAGDADASWAALILVHVVFVLPYVFLSLSAPWRAYDGRYEAVAAALGAPAGRVFWRVRMPMLLRAVLVAAAVGFAVSVGQYLPTLLVGAGRFPTITTEAVALGSGGDRRVIGVYAFLQMLLPFVGFALATLVPALLFRNRRAIRGL